MHHGSTLRLLSLLFCCFSLLIPLGLLAQRPVSIIPPTNGKLTPAENKMMDCNDAGEISQFSGFDMESNSFGDNLMATDVLPYGSRPEIIYLCAGDEFTVDLVDGSTVISGDPDPSTVGGVGYGFYSCSPTVSGPTLADIDADPCVADDGLAPFNEFAIGVPENYATGDYTLTLANNSVGGFTIPALFPTNGEPTPVIFDLAPITFDNVNVAEGRALYDGDPEGPCVNVSLDQTFRVAYLNPITVPQINDSPAGCEGFFDLRGGTPELLGGPGYNIVIEETTTGARGVITTPANEIVHNAVIRYKVPEAGTYRITVEDGNSCSLNGGTGITVSHPDISDCQQSVVLTLPTGRGLPMQSLCLPVTVENFNAIVGFQFDLGFDPAVLMFETISGFNPNLTGTVQFNGPVSSGGTLAEGLVRFSYTNFGNPATIPDGEVLFDFCFTVLGEIGDQTPLTSVGPVAEFTRDPMSTGDLVVNPGVVVVTEKAFLVELERDNENCNNSNDGSITASANGSDSPYTFSIRPLNVMPFSDPQTRSGSPAVATFNGLSDDQYAIQVVSAGGDVVIDTIEVEAGLTIAVNIRELREPSCNGLSDGAVFANVIGVADPLTDGYTFEWAGSNETSDTLRDLTAGLYTVTVTAPNGLCTTFDSGNLGEPSEVRVRPDLPSDAVSNATCSGTPDGSITISADGGTGPFDFLWPAPLTPELDVTMSSRDMLVPGEYEVIVEDSRGCRDTSNFVVDAQKTLDIVPEVDSISCFGDANGAIRVNGTATGAPPVGNYEVSLENLTTMVTEPFQTITDNSVPFEFSNLGPARYVVTLRDQDPAGCLTTDTFDIFEPPLLEIDDNLTVTNETCTIGMDGTATADVTGGTMPYVYRWVNDSLDMAIDTITPGNLLTGLSADTNYVLIVTDVNGCTDTASFRINAPAAALLLPIDTSFISCPGDNDGRLTVVATPPPGETITRITWFRVNADGTLGAPVEDGLAPMTDDNLPVGRYAVRVETSNDCTNFAEGFVVSPGEVSLVRSTVIDPQCPGDPNGSITLTPRGGTPNADGTYNYVWSTDPFGTPTTNPAFTGLRAGSYTVTITDGNGCQPPFDTTFMLTDPPAIIGSFQLTPVSCPDDMVMDGTATFTAEYDDGSVGSFDFRWPSGTADFSTNTSTETGLARGAVTVEVTDGLCFEEFADTILSPEDFEVELLVTPVTCNGLVDGAATVVISGGTPGYDYSWSVAPDTDSIVSGISAGMGTLDISDANGCSPGTQTFTVAQPDPLTLSIDPVQTTQDVRCAGDRNGRVGVFVSSVNNNELAMNPYTWSGNVAGPEETLARDLGPGTYSVTVTDVEGCQDSVNFTIGEPEPIVFSVLPIEEPLCFGQTTPVLIDTAFGGTSNGIEDFSFSVNNDGFRIPVGQTGTAFAGDVVVSVFDSVGCSAEQTFSINQPPQIIIDLADEIIIELGDSLTRLNPLISPAGDVYEYLWTPGEFLSSDSVRNPFVVPFSDVDYTFRATNSNGCQAFADIFVEVDANRNVYIPNVFSPNRDGRNEDFRIFACQGVQRVLSVDIFDRWGGLLFSENSFDPNCLDGIKLWDGMGQNGKPVNPGVFVYIIEVEFLDNVKLLYRGDITVLRE